MSLHQSFVLIISEANDCLFLLFKFISTIIATILVWLIYFFWYFICNLHAKILQLFAFLSNQNKKLSNLLTFKSVELSVLCFYYPIVNSDYSVLRFFVYKFLGAIDWRLFVKYLHILSKKKGLIFVSFSSISFANNVFIILFVFVYVI